MTKSVEQHAFDILQEHLDHRPKRKRVIKEAKLIIEEGRLLALTGMIYNVLGSEHKGKRESYQVTQGIGAGPASCTCRAKDFSHESCKHWLAVIAYTGGIERRKRELEEERAEMLRQADIMLEELSELGGVA